MWYCCDTKWLARNHSPSAPSGALTSPSVLSHPGSEHTAPRTPAIPTTFPAAAPQKISLRTRAVAICGAREASVNINKEVDWDINRLKALLWAPQKVDSPPPWAPEAAQRPPKRNNQIYLFIKDYNCFNIPSVGNWSFLLKTICAWNSLYLAKVSERFFVCLPHFPSRFTRVFHHS